MQHPYESFYTKTSKKIKDLIAEETTLAYLTHTDACDMAGKRLSAALLQEGKPVAFCSKDLTQMEQCNVNVEWKMLVMVYRCKDSTHSFALLSKAQVDHPQEPQGCSSLSPVDTTLHPAVGSCL